MLGVQIAAGEHMGSAICVIYESGSRAQTEIMGRQIEVNGVVKYAQRGYRENGANCQSDTQTKEQKTISMDRQMERSLFRNDSEAQPRAKQGERSVAKEARQLADEPTKANADKRASVTLEGMRAILIQQDYRCALSGVVLSPDCASLDHIRPLSKGGQHVLSNVQIVHPIVNGLKGEMTQDEFIQWVNLIASNTKEDS